MIADALTKLVFTLRGKAAGLLAQYRADALLLERNGTAILDVSLAMRHPRPDSIRLKHLQRYFLYVVVALLFFSGVAWTYWNYLAVSPGDF